MVDKSNSDEPVSLLSLDGQQLKYRGEGNGSVVVAVGDTGKILRLIKVEKGRTAAPSTSPAAIGRRLNEIVGVGAEHLRRLNRELESVRPDFRKKKIIAETDSYALLMPDLCSSWTLKQLVPNAKLCGPILTVEIKPKMGFAMKCTGSTTAEQRARICKYHLMQQWKLKKNKISKVSSYCPLDLFSGCPFRLRRAVRDLFNNPQNNLRLFLDGKLMFGDGIDRDVEDATPEFFPCESSVCDQLCELIAEALLRNHSSDDADTEIKQTGEKETEICGCKQRNSNQGLEPHHHCEKCHLSAGCILNRILRMQMLSVMDAKDVLPIYNQWRHELEELPYERLQQLLYNSKINSLSICKSEEGTFEWAVHKIRLYLLSCTAKDCSIMMTFSRCSEQSGTEENNPWIIKKADGSGRRVYYAHSIAMVDVDWKSPERIPQHAELEENLFV